MNMPRRSAAGLSLIELMVAMLIGTLLVLGLVQVFSASRTAYQLSEALARTQENGRFALDYLQRDIRMVGHSAALTIKRARRFPVLSLPIWPLVVRSIMCFHPWLSKQCAGHRRGSELQWSATIGGQRHPGAAVSGRQWRPITLIAPKGGTGPGGSVSVDPAKWSPADQDGVTTPQMFGVADCSFADVFQASGVNSATGVVTAPDTVDLARYTSSPAGQAVLYRADTVVYYVATGAGGGPSLFRKRYTAANTGTTEELVEGNREPANCAMARTRP